MSIAVHCACGSALKVDQKHAGKKVRCPKCQKVNVVPEAAEPDVQIDEAPTPPAAPSPAAGIPSYLLAQRSGLHQDEEQPPQPTVIPVKQIVGLSVFVVAVIAGWFIIQALVTQSGAEAGREFFEYARFDHAIEFLEVSHGRTEGPEKAALARMIKQVRQEQELNAEEVLQAGKPIKSEHITLKPRKITTIKLTRVTGFTFENTTDHPITLHRDYFYLRGSSDLVLGAPDSNLNQFDHVVVEPGQTYEGEVAFRRVPVPAVGSIMTPMAMSQWSLIFNDGEHYVKAGIPEK